MPLNLASPGVLVREVDLTVGRVDPTSASIGAIVSPFAQGPVEVPTLISNEKDLLDIFGKPQGTDNHYEHWLVASSFLAYGGSLRVVRADDTDLKNANDQGASLKIKSSEHYEQLGYDQTPVAGATVIARNPGSWGNGLRVGVIDAKADQILTVSTTSVTNFVADIENISGSIAIGAATTIGITTTSIVLGQEVRGNFVSTGTTVTDISTNVITISQATTNIEGGITVPLDFGSRTTISAAPEIGYGIEQSVVGKVRPGAGSTSVLDGVLKGIITEVGDGEISVKVLEHIASDDTVTSVEYEPGGTWEFSTGNIGFHTNGESVSYGTTAVTAEKDWYDQQTLTLSDSVTVNWNSIAERPSTTSFGAQRGARFDELHVVVVDGDGAITGNSGSVLERHIGLSKAKDAEFSFGSPSYWRKYLQSNSGYIFAGSQPAGIVTTAYDSGTFDLVSDEEWEQDAEGVAFGAIGNSNNQLTGGLNYDGLADTTAAGSLSAGLNGLTAGYDLFDTENFNVDFILMGSAAYAKEQAQALANKCIAIAEARQDAIAFISPYRGAAITDTTNDSEVNIRSDADITDNVTSFYAPITSSSYAVFDSGYKYMFDRFSNTFRYVPLNGDIAGSCARTDSTLFPWFSPAGTNRGAILNAVKLAYNPNKTQRDRLYTNRINPVIFSPGAGIVLFGDKTGLAKSSAFDRINVRRLFIYLADAISAAAKDQLFEFNDEITRTNFVNIVEPFLRDVQAKRGIFDFVVICDETNNTAAVIDNNEFVADIYIKPTRSINFIGLTFVATRTGVSFEEVIGNV